MAGSMSGSNGYAGVTSQFAASGWARSELALNQDKRRLQLRRSGSPVNQARSFKFTACAVSDVPNTALSPRSAAIVPGRRSNSPVLRGLKVGEIISVLRERSPESSAAGESMAWPHRRGNEPVVVPNNFHLGRALRSGRSASPPRGSRSGNADDEARMVAMFAAVSTEQEAEVDVLNLGPSVGGPDGRTRPLSPRVRESDWLDGLSARVGERGGSRLFPTHLAKSSKSKEGAAPKAGGAYVVSGSAASPQAPAKAPAGNATKRSPRAQAKAVPEQVVAAKKVPRELRNSKKLAAGPKDAKHTEGQPESEPPRQEEKRQTPIESMKETLVAQRANSKEIPKQGLSKLQLLRKRLEDTMRAAESISQAATPAEPTQP